jgi:hypothetical protein
MAYTEVDYEPYVDAIITDDDLVLGSKITLKWPDITDRLNHAVVRYHNEAENFKEDTVSWPLKTTYALYRGIGGTTYVAAFAGWGASGEQGAFLNKYAIWESLPSNENLSKNFRWLFRPPTAGVNTYTGRLEADDSAVFSILDIAAGTPVTLVVNGQNYQSLPVSWANNVNRNFTVSLSGEKEYLIEYRNGTNTGGSLKGIAANLIYNSIVVWSTRTPSYEFYQEETQTNEVYNELLAEDNNVPLETTIFLEGCTTYSHALAKAEELVRTSRTAIGVTFEYIVKDKFLEPGDLVKIESKTIDVFILFYIRVNEVKYSIKGTCQVTGTRFLFEQLAWNVADDEYPSNSTSYGASGTFYWDHADNPTREGYLVYIWRGEYYQDGSPLMHEIGFTSSNSFEIPDTFLVLTKLGVKTKDKNNKMSEMAILDNVVLRYKSELQLVSNLLSFNKFLNGTFNVSEITLTAVLRDPPPQHLLKYKWYVDTVLQTGEESSTFVLERPNPFAVGTMVVDVEVYSDDPAYSYFNLFDKLSIFKLIEGTEHADIVLANEIDWLDVDYTNTPVENELPYYNHIIGVLGITLLTPGVNVTYSIAATLNCTASFEEIDGYEWVFKITAVDQTANVVSVTINAVIPSINTTLQRTFHLFKLPAKNLSLTFNANTLLQINTTSTGAPKSGQLPKNFTIEAFLQGSSLKASEGVWNAGLSKFEPVINDAKVMYMVESTNQCTIGHLSSSQGVHTMQVTALTETTTPASFIIRSEVIAPSGNLVNLHNYTINKIIDIPDLVTVFASPMFLVHSGLGQSAYIYVLLNNETYLNPATDYTVENIYSGTNYFDVPVNTTFNSQPAVRFDFAAATMNSVPDGEYVFKVTRNTVEYFITISIRDSRNFGGGA